MEGTGKLNSKKELHHGIARARHFHCGSLLIFAEPDGKLSTVNVLA
jgi:hypothetical protein